MEKRIFWRAAISLSSTHFLVEGEVMAIGMVEIDLAKSVFAVHGVDELTRRAIFWRPGV